MKNRLLNRIMSGHPINFYSVKFALNRVNIVIARFYCYKIFNF